jgi:hypothetical protein
MRIAVANREDMGTALASLGEITTSGIAFVACLGRQLDIQLKRV